MAEAPATLRDQQFAFARHLRDPDRYPAPAGIEDRRLAVYRDLFHNNIAGLLGSNFPVIRKTLGDAAWNALVRAFQADYRCHTPLFTEIGREFTRFLEQRQGIADDPPWLAELAHYEWIELALQLADDPMPAHDPEGDLLAGTPVVSPFARALAYRWPVQRIAPDCMPSFPGDAPTLLLVRRDLSGSVHFSEISALVFRLLQLLDERTSSSGHDALLQLAREAQAQDPPAFVQSGAAMLQRLREEGTVLGVAIP